MKKYILFIVFSSFMGCSSNRTIQLMQEDNKDTFIGVVFFLNNDESIDSGVIELRKKITVKNPNMNFSNTNINYIGEDDIIRHAYPTEFDGKNNEYRQFFNNGKLHQIKLNPLNSKEIYYFLLNDIDTLDFTNKYYKSLEQYKNLVKPTDVSSISPNHPIAYDILSYEEPFSEFKRKNPELLEFSTKGDSIELEVISPVKQKYKFKAEW